MGLAAPAAAVPVPKVDVAAPPGTITTLAGGTGGPGPATSIALQAPCAVTYAAGSLYFTDASNANNYFGPGGGPSVAEVIRQVSASTDALTTVGGAAGVGSTPDGGLASGGLSGVSCGIAVDHAGDVLFSEGAWPNHFPTTAGGPFGQNRVRVIAHGTGTFYGQPMLAGHVYTIVGTGVAGRSGDGGPAVRARLHNPSGLAVDRAGNVIIVDSFSEEIRVVAARSGTFYGERMRAGDIYTVAGDGHSGYSGNGRPGRQAMLRLAVTPPNIDYVSSQVAVDHFGNLVIADPGNRLVRVVPDRSGTYYGQRMLAGHIYNVAGAASVANLGRCGRNFGDAGPALLAHLCLNSGVAVDGAGNLVITDTGHRMIKVIAVRNGTFYGKAMLAGHIYRVLGSIGATWLTIDAAGNVLFVSGVTFRANEFQVRALAVHTGQDFHIVMTAGHLYPVVGDGQATSSGDSGPATAAQLGGLPGQGIQTMGTGPGLVGLATDPSGNIVIGDTANSRVRLVAAQSGAFYGQPTTAGDIYTIANESELGGLAANSAGDLAITSADTRVLYLMPAVAGQLFGIALTPGNVYELADACPFDGKICEQFQSVAFDSAGNVIVAACPVFEVSNMAQVYVVAARDGTFYGQPMLAGQEYLLAGTGTAGYSGDGGPAQSAQVGCDSPASDGHGNVLLADPASHRVRVVAATSGTFYGVAMTAGDIYTIAGDGTSADSGDGGPALAAEIADPESVAADAAGNVIIADEVTNRVRVIAATSGTFYGVAMTAGDIYTIAGDGTVGFTGDGGPATQAELAFPSTVTVVPGSPGGILVGDIIRVRMISG